MFTGTMIDELMAAVARAEEQALTAMMLAPAADAEFALPLHQYSQTVLAGVA